MTRDADCVFCKIAAGELPATTVLEDEAAVALMDIRPLAEGHVLLVPRGHFVTLDEMPADAASAMLRHLPALVKAVQAATGCEGVNVLQNNGRVAHQEVLHVHFHVIPRTSGDAWHFNWPAGDCSSERLAELAEKIRSAV